mmetsp:Transcript_21396/g.39972  ORF Transcript_21396/g.39972 Transcript_21396/m.39972 type:complete len:270 (-) Transcript_21396:378-1187(-)
MLPSDLQPVARLLRRQLLPHTGPLRHIDRVRVPSARGRVPGASNHGHVDRRGIHLRPGGPGPQDGRVLQGLSAPVLQRVRPRLQLRRGFRGRLRLFTTLGRGRSPGAEPRRRHGHLRLPTVNYQHGLGLDQELRGRRGRGCLQRRLRQHDRRLPESRPHSRLPRRAGRSQPRRRFLQAGIARRLADLRRPAAAEILQDCGRLREEVQEELQDGPGILPRVHRVHGILQDVPEGIRRRSRRRVHNDRRAVLPALLVHGPGVARIEDIVRE